MLRVPYCRRALACLALLATTHLTVSQAASPINSPYPSGAESSNTLFAAFFGGSPKTSDPALSYSVPETTITYNVYEPLYRYHYLKRPYELEGNAAEAVVVPQFLDREGRVLPPDAPAEAVAESVYDFKIRPGMRFAPHPAFARQPDGAPTYYPVNFDALKDVFSPMDFPEKGTRELTAYDFEYGIKRLSSPRLPSPIFGTIGRRIVGMQDYAAQLKEIDKPDAKGQRPSWLDLRQYPLEGVQALDDRTLRIRVLGKDPQFKYWLAMNFFAPVPWEAERFYNQPGMAERNLGLARWPVGAGPYFLADFQLNRSYTLERNPNYWGLPYPCEGSPEDQARGYLDDCGKPTPFIDRAEFILEKESIPRQGKFLQGYYDSPGLDRSEYGVAMLVAAGDNAEKAALYKERGLLLETEVEQATWYLGFNWLDPVVGKGDTPEQQERNRKLRLAVSLALDWSEQIAIFQQGQGHVSHGPIPPGVFGFREGADGVNTELFDIVDGKAVLKPIETAKKWLAEAGYPDGRSAETGAPLVLNFDSMVGGGSNPQYDWMRRSLARLNIQLDLRATDYNRFQDKMMKGSAQIYQWGWNGDYPDAENFLTLLYGPSAKALHGGENASNYSNAAYDKLYKRMVTLEDGPEKQALIDQMVQILRHDAVWNFAYHPVGSGAYHKWVGNSSPSKMIRNSLQFFKLDTALRTESIRAWNQPVWWPLLVVVAVLGLIILVSWRTLRRTQKQTAFGADSRATARTHGAAE